MTSSNFVLFLSPYSSLPLLFYIRTTLTWWIVRIFIRTRCLHISTKWKCDTKRCHHKSYHWMMSMGRCCRRFFSLTIAYNCYCVDTVGICVLCETHIYTCQLIWFVILKKREFRIYFHSVKLSDRHKKWNISTSESCWKFVVCIVDFPSLTFHNVYMWAMRQQQTHIHEESV